MIYNLSFPLDTKRHIERFISSISHMCLLLFYRVTSNIQKYISISLQHLMDFQCHEYRVLKSHKIKSNFHEDDAFYATTISLVSVLSCAAWEC